MKTCLLGVTLLLSTALSADPIKDKPVASDQETDSTKKQEMLIITEAKLIPLIEFLGLPDVNNLPPTSSGKTKPDHSQEL